MVRRHFRGILQLFPELATKMETEAWSAPLVPCSALHSPEPAARKSEENKCEAKFSSPFSIESLLKRDSPTSRSSRPPPLSSVQVTQVGIKRSLCWNSAETVLLQASPGITPVCSTGGSTHQGLVAKRMHLNSEPPFPLYARADPYPSSYITYSVPAFSHDALCFRLWFLFFSSWSIALLYVYIWVGRPVLLFSLFFRHTCWLCLLQCKYFRICYENSSLHCRKLYI